VEEKDTIKMSSNTKTILILGGSYGGVGTAHYILKHVIPSLPKKDDYRVALVSSSSHFLVRPACPRALVSENALPRDKLFVPLTAAFEQYTSPTITLYHGTVTKLDHSACTASVISSSDNTEINIDYYALIIATGATAASPLLGLFGDHRKTEEAWTLFQKKLPTAKSIVIVGGGPSGVETAGELGQHLKAGSGSNVAITLVTKGKQLLPDLPLSVSQKAESQLSKLGVSVLKTRSVEKVTSIGTNSELAGSYAADKNLEQLTEAVTVHLDDGKTLQADLYIPSIGITPNTSFLDKGLLDKGGYVKVDSSSLRVENAGPRVYSLGHVCSSKPQAIHAIMGQAPVIGENLKQDLLAAGRGVEADKTKYRAYEAESRVSQLVVIGKKGVGLAFGWKIPSFLVWLIKGRDYWLGMTPPMWNGKQFAKPI
jgi:apoptosis-inducing factor 2